jgi:hypothetical protein
MSSRILGHKRDNVTGAWRRLPNYMLHNLYSSLDIIRVIKSTRVRWTENVTSMGERRISYKILVKKPEGR